MLATLAQMGAGFVNALTPINLLMMAGPRMEAPSFTLIFSTKAFLPI